MNGPRYMHVGGIMAAYHEKEVEVWGLKDIDVDLEKIGLSGSPTKVKKSFTKGAKEAGEKYHVSAHEASKLIYNKLKEKFVI